MLLKHDADDDEEAQKNKEVAQDVLRRVDADVKFGHGIFTVHLGQDISEDAWDVVRPSLERVFEKKGWGFLLNSDGRSLIMMNPFWNRLIRLSAYSFFLVLCSCTVCVLVWATPRMLETQVPYLIVLLNYANVVMMFAGSVVSFVKIIQILTS